MLYGEGSPHSFLRILSRARFDVSKLPHCLSLNRCYEQMTQAIESCTVHTAKSSLVTTFQVSENGFDGPQSRWWKRNGKPVYVRRDHQLLEKPHYQTGHSRIFAYHCTSAPLRLKTVFWRLLVTPKTALQCFKNKGNNKEQSAFFSFDQRQRKSARNVRKIELEKPRPSWYRKVI